MPQLVIGIDIGVTGALTCISTRARSQAHIQDMPAVARGKAGAKVSNEINAAGLADMLRALMTHYEIDPNDAIAVVERVSAMPGQGSSSGFSLGDSSGVIRAVLATLRIPTHFITPANWKKHFNIRANGPPKKEKGQVFTAEEMNNRSRARAAAKGEAKEQARALVIQLYPGISATVARKADHNRAESVLIARYGLERLI